LISCTTHCLRCTKKKYQDFSEKYIEKCHNIINGYNSDPIKVLKYLDVNKKFWLIDSENFNENGEVKTPQDGAKPYQDAINELSKLVQLKSPREKLTVLLMMHSSMKSYVVNFYKGKEELHSMDDELPIIIYIIVHAQVPDLEAELAFVEDFINLDPTLESEKRLMTNLRVSVQYIVKEWQVEVEETQQ